MQQYDKWEESGRRGKKRWRQSKPAARMGWNDSCLSPFCWWGWRAVAAGVPVSPLPLRGLFLYFACPVIDPVTFSYVFYVSRACMRSVQGEEFNCPVWTFTGASKQANSKRHGLISVTSKNAFGMSLNKRCTKQISGLYHLYYFYKIKGNMPRNKLNCGGCFC